MGAPKIELPRPRGRPIWAVAQNGEAGCRDMRNELFSFLTDEEDPDQLPNAEQTHLTGEGHKTPVPYETEHRGRAEKP